LNWQGSLLLHDNRTRRHAVTVADIPNAEANKIAGSEFAVQPEIKKRKLSGSVSELKAYSDSPDVL
jgi:hypothetical protein